MAESLDTHAAAREIARRDRAYVAHLVLCACMLGWRMFDATPGAGWEQNGSFAGSPAGVALSMVTLWLGVVCLLVVIASTVRTLKDARLWLLFVLMSLSMLWRHDIDVFDITYVALAAILSAWWFNAGRARFQDAPVAPVAGPFASP
jgi:hypothetical protein